MTPALPPRDLESSDDALEDLYELAPCGYVSTSIDGTILRVNATFLRWTGYAPEQLIGRPFTSILSIGSQLFYETRFLNVLYLQGEAREVALSLEAADGRRMPILVNATTVAGADGRAAIIRTAIFDSTSRQDYERDLLDARRLAEASEKRVRVLQDASSTFVAAASEVDLADDLARSARSAFAASHVAVYLLDGDGRLKVVSGNALPHYEAVGAATPGDEVIRTGAALTLSRRDDAAGLFSGLAEALRSARVESISVVPIMDEGTPLGVVICYFGRTRAFDAQEIELQLALARQAAQLLTRLRLQRQLERLALYDQLTGLANRKLLREHFAQTLAEALRNERDMGLVFVDLDGFKAINDQFGHSVGDRVLTEVGQRLSAVVRDGDMVGRFGGDEFVMICEDADATAAASITDRLRDALRSPLAAHPSSAGLTASVGVALLEGAHARGVTVDKLFEAADAAMYASKREGKNRVTITRVRAEADPL